jgi:hypothetical protein
VPVIQKIGANFTDKYKNLGILLIEISRQTTMAGNEVAVCRFIFSNLNQISLKHLGQIKLMAVPLGKGGYELLIRFSDVDGISTSDARKKADIYLNGRGVSIKQTGATVLYNRLQRRNLNQICSMLEIADANNKSNQLDLEISRFHRGEILRDRSWASFFTESEFKQLLEFLMLKGSPNYDLSQHPAELILEAPKQITSSRDLKVYTFDEYFDKYKNAIKIAIRRSWVGQVSKTEHGRAKSISKQADNLPWVFNEVMAEPPTGWRDSFPSSERKTVYYLMILK